MPRKNPAAKTPSSKNSTAKPLYKDPVSMMMAMLLPIHSAATLEWLVDATATAAERTVNATFAFTYSEAEDGRLERKSPASDLRRRSQERAVRAFGKDLLHAKLDPANAPSIAEALDGGKPIVAGAGELFRGLIDEKAAEAAQKELGIDAISFVPLESAGERLGALLLLHTGTPNDEHVRLLADHVACATVNLRQSQAARETGVIDVVRSVFDARKIESDLQRELARAERYKREVSIAVIEATNLRLLRERFGAFLTDRLLQRLGQMLASHSRDIDVIGAYKESGYTMILTEASPEGAAVAADRLLRMAQEIAVDADAVPGLELHLATGWATCPTDGVTTAAIFAAAERRMYGGATRVA
jgi:diguanylate cyclase (GGDEF)-like protein